MASYTIEFKKKTGGGFTHSRRVVEGQDNVADAFNEAMNGNIEGLEFFTVRMVKPKPEPKIKEIKK